MNYHEAISEVFHRFCNRIWFISTDDGGNKIEGADSIDDSSKDRIYFEALPNRIAARPLNVAKVICDKNNTTITTINELINVIENEINRDEASIWFNIHFLRDDEKIELTFNFSK